MKNKFLENILLSLLFTHKVESRDGVIYYKQFGRIVWVVDKNGKVVIDKYKLKIKGSNL